MKAILLSIRPEWVAKILNGEKTIEIRKQFPKNYIGWVYVYVSKTKPYVQYSFGYNDYEMRGANKYFLFDKPQDITPYNGNDRVDLNVLNKNSPFKADIDAFQVLSIPLNGKIVARFWCDKVEEFRPFFHWCIEKETCLTRDNVLDYLDNKDKSVGNPKRQGKVFAIHISKLEIFDKSKELKEFNIKGKYTCSKSGCPYFATDKCRYASECLYEKPLTKAPQNWCYVEI